MPGELFAAEQWCGGQGLDPEAGSVIRTEPFVNIAGSLLEANGFTSAGERNRAWKQGLSFNVVCVN